MNTCKLETTTCNPYGAQVAALREAPQRERKKVARSERKFSKQKILLRSRTKWKISSRVWQTTSVDLPWKSLPVQCGTLTKSDQDGATRSEADLHFLALSKPEISINFSRINLPAARIKDAGEMLAGWHQAGVRFVTPNIRRLASRLRQ